MRYVLRVTVDADSEMGWTYEGVVDEITEALSHYGDLSVKVELDSARGLRKAFDQVADLATLLAQGDYPPSAVEAFGLIDRLKREAEAADPSKRPQASKNFPGDTT
jgi:hypothetical protein